MHWLLLLLWKHLQSKCLETLLNIFQRYLQRRKFTMSSHGVPVCITKLILNFFWFYENIYQLGVENWINNAKSWARPYHQDQNLKINQVSKKNLHTHLHDWTFMSWYGNSQIPENPILIKTGNSACLSISSHMIHVMVG